MIYRTCGRPLFQPIVCLGNGRVQPSTRRIPTHAIRCDPTRSDPMMRNASDAAPFLAGVSNLPIARWSQADPMPSTLGWNEEGLARSYVSVVATRRAAALHLYLISIRHPPSPRRTECLCVCVCVFWVACQRRHDEEACSYRSFRSFVPSF